jgi:transcriptional regulator with XRE-family HTH domain
METTIRVIGQTIHELRAKRGLTLDEVAERSGCTSGFLSQIERNKAVPSITTLYAIAEALGVQITDFLPEDLNGTKVVRAAGRETFQFEGSPAKYAMLTTKFPYAALGAFLMTIKPANLALPPEESRAHPGEEFFYVMEGVLRVWIADGFHDLYPGDSAHFKSTVKHRLENRGSQPVVVLGVVTPSIF